MGPAAAAGALRERHSGRGRRRRGIVFRHIRQRVDEPSVRVHAGRRAGGRRPPVAGAVRQPDVLERIRAHVFRGVYRVRVPAGRGVRGADAAGAARAVPADGAPGFAERRVGGRAAASDRRRLGGARRGPVSAGETSGDGGTGNHYPRSGRAPAGLVQRARGRVGHRDPPAAVAARGPQPFGRGEGAGYRTARRPAAGQRGADIVPGDGRDRLAASPARARIPVPPVPAARAAALGAGLRRGRRAVVGGRAYRRLDHNRSGTAAVDRLRRDAGVRRSDGRQRHPDRVRDAVGRLRHPGGDRVGDPAAARPGTVAA